MGGAKPNRWKSGRQKWVPMLKTARRDQQRDKKHR